MHAVRHHMRVLRPRCLGCVGKLAPLLMPLPWGLPCCIDTAQLEQLAAKASRKLGDEIDYHSIPTLSLEAREKLSKV